MKMNRVKILSSFFKTAVAVQDNSIMFDWHIYTVNQI